MTIPSSSPARQLTPVVSLSGREAEEFLSGFAVNDEDCTLSHTVDQLAAAFKHLSGETQRLLVRNLETGLVSETFIRLRLDDHCFILFAEWDESGKYESLTEATAIADSRLFSYLLVLEYLDASLQPLGCTDEAVCLLMMSALNEFVEASCGEHPEGSAYRLSTVDDVARIASLVTYAAVDGFLSDEEVALNGRDHRDPLVLLVPNVYPRSSMSEGFHCDNLVIVHPDLELRLRGRSLGDYESAQRMVIDRGIGVSVEDAEFVMEHVGKTAAPLLGGTL